MRIAYRAKSLADARNIFDLLASAGIAAHIADEALWPNVGELQGADFIRVLVDNKAFDPARRLLERWAHGRSPRPEH